ncbi:MAG: 50S ribosomal protein L6 [Deltaproteobacteria bacterium]|nr:50S ribosomal protein L6 [Deltaproteobacteria bacterium]
MSRVGKKPIPIPGGVDVSITDNQVAVKGQKGQLSHAVHSKVNVVVQDGQITVGKVDESKLSRSLYGTTRTVLSNMVVGVTEGFSRVLEVIGVGYRVEVQGSILVLNLGYSNPVRFSLPEGITAETDKQNRITLRGIDRQHLGQVAANIRALRPPEPYKGKGIKYVEETIRRKVGKTGGK